MSDDVVLKEPHVLPDSVSEHPDLFEYLMQLPGKSYRKVTGRETLKVEIGGRSYFIKKHFGVGWLEVFKNWLSLKRPVVSAANEVAAIAALQELNIPTTPYVGHGVRGHSLASQRSFILTEDLGDIVTLEDLALRWKTLPPTLKFKRELIRRVAEIAHVMHTHNIYHRDFYICHFCFKAEEIDQASLRLHVLDLHRADIRAKASQEMQKKDLAALYFSAMDIGLSRGDLLTFLKQYTANDRFILRGESEFYQSIKQRASKLYAKFQRKVRAGISM